MKKYLLLLTLLTFIFIQSVYAQVSSPILEVPPDLDRVVSTTVTLRWQDLTGVLSYTFDIANDPSFFTESGPGVTVTASQYTFPAGTLSPSTLYYWKVRGNYSSGPGPYSSTFSFTTAGTPSQETDYLKGVIESLSSSNSINGVQANILNNRLNQAQHQMDLNHDAQAIIHLALFDVRVLVLQYSGQLSNQNGHNLINYADNIIQLIFDGNSKIPHNIAELNAIPNEYSLGQNYPNPFNPSTNIEYSIPKGSDVTLKIYDILGKEVATLVNKQQDAGAYIVTWNASSNSSGVYFYRITAGSFVQTKRMTLTK
jgi:hypothetical protein